MVMLIGAPENIHTGSNTGHLSVAPTGLSASSSLPPETDGDSANWKNDFQDSHCSWAQKTDAERTRILECRRYMHRVRAQRKRTILTGMEASLINRFERESESLALTHQEAPAFERSGKRLKRTPVCGRV